MLHSSVFSSGSTLIFASTVLVPSCVCFGGLGCFSHPHNAIALLQNYGKMLAELWQNVGRIMAKMHVASCKLYLGTWHHELSTGSIKMQLCYHRCGLKS